MGTPTRTGDAVVTTGLWIALASAAAFGTSGALARSLLEIGWSPGAAVTGRIGVSAVVLAVPAIVALRGHWHLLRRNARLVLSYGVIAMAMTQFAYFSAVQTLSVGVALLLEYLGLVLVVLWLWLRHAQRPHRATVLGVVLSVAGLVLVLDLAGAVRVDAGGALWGLGAACGLAVYFVLSADVSTGLPPLVLAAGGMVVASLVLGVAGLTGLMPLVAVAADVDIGGLSVPWWAALGALAVVSTVLAYSSGIAATRRLGAKLASFVGLTEVLFAIAFAWLVIGELPRAVQLVGGALILAGVAAIRYDELTRRRGPAPGLPGADPATSRADRPA